ncbi:hypothetical protein CT0861_07070 [Colletotrichum tofieldiae]|uniref:Uncharacterized protein n=1 Tax=Colletotrichum tofieldiae TaxID=708197 RepID=A0A166SPT1_9PEZI|nr:hypothetical protein CT0861_07070 [Colletotrichum tofieldiae]
MTKIRTETSSPEELSKKCEEQIGQRCSRFEWKSLKDLEEHTPDSKTMFLLVNFPESSAAIIYIFEHANNRFIDSVSSNKKAHTVIIPWVAGRSLKCFGSCKIGEVEILSNEGSST